MTSVFRVDASNRMGSGHLRRCLALAEVLRDRGVEVAFVCREHPGNMIDVLSTYAMPVTVLPAPPPSIVALGVEDYATWLGATQIEDAAQTVAALRGHRPHWLIVDHYGLDLEWERHVRTHVEGLLSIDDLANRRHDCDVLLNQNYSLEPPDRYERLLPTGARVLLGPRYALLGREYAAYRQAVRSRDRGLRRLLVFFGSADPHNMTGLALEVLSRPEWLALEVDVVVGADHAHRLSIEAQVARRPHTYLHGPRPHLADLIANADIGLGAGGVATWERMCLGLPSLVVSCADNQQAACDALARSGLIHYLGRCSEVRPADITAALLQWKEKKGAMASLASRAQREVDGLGAFRLAEVLDPTSTQSLVLRPAPAAESGRRFELYAGVLPVGHMSIKTREGQARVVCEIEPCVEGRGWDAHLLMAANDRLQDSQPVRLNQAAGAEDPRAVFLRPVPAGADTVGEESASGPTFSLAILSDRESWLNSYLAEMALEWLGEGHRVLWTHVERALRPADFCFYLGCGQVVSKNTLSDYRHNLVVHESDLPQGKGWSPLTWQILEGRNRIVVTLFEATDRVDSGVVYAQECLELAGHELIEELRAAQAAATRNLCRRFINDYPKILQSAREQSGSESFYRRRRPADSRVDAGKTIEEQFAAFRVADNDRYPAFFERRGMKYEIRIRKAGTVE